MIKPGYRTSEFWFTLVSFIFSGLYLMGLLDNNTQKEDLIQETSKGLEATILIIGQLTVLFKYINGRTKLKQTWWSTATPEERKIQDKINRRRKSVKRNIKSTTKPTN
jgi:uncharacterized protein YegJ (DUF2314 family)